MNNQLGTGAGLSLDEHGIAHKETSLRRLLILLAVFGAIGLMGMAVFVLVSGDDDTGPPEDRPAVGDPGDPIQPATVAGLAPALAAVAAENEQTPSIWEVEIWREQVDISIQVQDQPQQVNRHRWADGALLDPQTVNLSPEATATMSDRLFEVDDFDTDAAIRVIEDAMTRHPDHPATTIQVTSFYITRSSPQPDMHDVVMRLHGRDDTGGRWLLTYDADGELIDTFRPDS